MTIKNNVDERGPRGRRGHDATSAATVDVSSSAAAAAAPPTYEVHGVGMAFAKAESQRLAIASLFDGIVAATGGLIDPSAPPNVAKILNEQRKAQQKKRSEMGRLMLELENSSRPNAEHKSSKGGWTATVTAYVDGGKKVESVGVGNGKSDAEDIAYANISDSLADTMGVLRHSTLQKIVDNSPGGSVASLRVPPLPDDAMDCLIAAMGTPEDHDRRMAAWKRAEQIAIDRIQAQILSDAGAGTDGGYRRAKVENTKHADAAANAAARAVSELADGEDLSEDPFLFNARREEISARFKAEEAARAAAAAADADSPEGKMKAVRDKLPILKIRESLVEALKTNPVVVVSGGTGSGKSTQCPQYILEHAIATGAGPDTRIIVTQPRRIAAVSVAERVAAERSEKAGNSIGFRRVLYTGPHTTAFAW